nr:hypothetical protein [Agrobacterium rosae]
MAEAEEGGEIGVFLITGRRNEKPALGSHKQVLPCTLTARLSATLTFPRRVTPLLGKEVTENFNAFWHRMALWPHEADVAYFFLPVFEYLDQPTRPQVTGNVPLFTKRNAQPGDTPHSQCVTAISHQITWNGNLAGSRA